MKIKKINLYTYELPLTRTLNINNQLMDKRKGVIVCLVDENNNKGYGEIAPLPGLHVEKYNNVLDQLKTISPEIVNANVIDINRFFDSINQIPGYEFWYPSVRFGIESVLINLAKILKQDFLDVLGINPIRNKIFVNALVSGDHKVILDKVSKKLSENFKSIKLKVGRDSIDKDIDIVKSVDEIIKNKATLRLDANRAWDFPTAVEFVRSVKNCAIEYIEEPLYNPTQLQELRKQTNILLALDESLSELSLDSIKSQSWIGAFVIKPSVIGSINKTLQLIKFARNSGTTVIISDTFQSGVGLSFLIWMAALIEMDTPMGFDTYPIFARDILEERHQLIDAKIEVEKSLNRAEKIAWPMLTEYFTHKA